MNDKKHWYDGHFYDKIIAPNQDKMFQQIKSLIPKQSSVIDVGCGTGRLAFQLAEHCNNILGLDLSSKNISVADSRLKIDKQKNISFFHGDIDKLKKHDDTKFDFAVMTYVIHEMPEEERIKVLLEMKLIARNIIVGDYITPTPNTFWGKANVVVEYFAGKDHYNNFKNYVKNGGIDFLISEANLSKIKDIKNQPQTSHLVLVE
ncbi:MAG: class I SAM-dependent methyltransferase [Ignavibacteriales bacterium]|nr:class I SAM-dependent methyltransferase [Ignavibacteriales bacterium]